MKRINLARSRPKIARRLLPAGAVIAALALTVQIPLPSGLAFHPNSHAMDLASLVQGNDGEADLGSAYGPDQEQFDDRAFPQTDIAAAQQQGASLAFQSVSKLPGGKTSNWQLVGPVNPTVPGVLTATGRSTATSGRITALAVSPNCHASDCKIFVGAAGGGVWEADNALVSQPNWHPAGDGIASNAIGSIIFDPTGQTVYVGTGEPNGSADSEAGVGLYKSTDFGRSWSLVSGSASVATGRSIGGIAVDPTNPSHIYVGTDVARHGSSSVNGGRFTQPGSPKVGLYESTDGGASFQLAFSKPSDPVVVGTATGLDFFRGGVTQVVFDPTNPGVVYFGMFDYGLFRRTASGKFEQVFASAGGGAQANSSNSRTAFALAPHGSKLRIYLGDNTSDASGNSGPADFYRVDNANVPAATLTTGTTNPGWTKLSNATKGTPGYGSYNFCGGQCWYDMVVASPPGQPDTVYIGGQMKYGERGGASNGRTVQRSTDAGVHFTDMTRDTQSPAESMHPDQHAIAFDSSNPNIGFFGSDGGLIRTSGSFTDASSQCSSRGLGATDLADCQAWLSAVPTELTALNDGLSTLQFQSASLNPQDPTGDVMGGTQDNGTWAGSLTGNGNGAGKWFETINGDGGQSGVDAVNPNIRYHTYFGPQVDVNFQRTQPLGWDWIADPLLASNEAASFYIPLIADPKVSGTMFAGLQHVWRTQDSGGSRAYLDSNCNEFTGAFAPNTTCGDLVPLGGATLTGSAYGTTKGTGYVVAITRAPSDTGTLWVGTRRGRIFISTNADAANPASVTFTRIDTPAQPNRFPSGIVVDPSNRYHAWVSFSGYNAYTPATPGHVFEVVYNPGTGTATWTDLSHNLGDLPITSVARDDLTGDLFASSDFGVAILPNGSTSWVPAAGSLPAVAVYGLTIDSKNRVLYAATHGRSVWKLAL